MQSSLSPQGGIVYLAFLTHAPFFPPPGGIVYRGLWTGVHVAIKFLKSSSPDQLNLTAKEAILARFVSHPNVVQVRNVPL